MCWNCDVESPTRKWMGMPLCQECWCSILWDNFWEMLDASGDLLDFQDQMVEVEVQHFRAVLDAY